MCARKHHPRTPAAPRTPAQEGPDLDFRPDYWDPADAVTAIAGNIKGAIRRDAVIRALTSRPEDAPGIALIPEDLRDDELDDGDRSSLGAVHPWLMGGEYLPRYLRGEVEIARIVMLSSTMDVVSIRARRRAGGRIRYRVVDEYETEFRFRPKSTAAPLTLGEVIGLVDSIRNPDYDDVPYLDALRDANFDGDPEEAAAFAGVESLVYSQLEGVYLRRADEWADAEKARIRAENGDDELEEDEDAAEAQVPDPNGLPAEGASDAAR